MKYNLVFTAEITEELNIPEEKKKELLSTEENKKIVEEGLRELCSTEEAEIIIHDFKLTERG